MTRCYSERLYVEMIPSRSLVDDHKSYAPK